MILNHKAAIELLVDEASEIGFNRYTILNLHGLFSDNLLADPQASGRLRQPIEERLQQILDTATAIDDPFEHFSSWCSCRISNLLERDLKLQVANEEDAIRALVSRLGRYRLAHIVIEATGRLEQPFVRAALAKGLPVTVVSPLKVRRYAGAIGQLAKTDDIDARLIAQFAAAVKPIAHAPSDPQAHKIKDLMVRRRQLTDMRTMEKNRQQVMPAELHRLACGECVALALNK